MPVSSGLTRGIHSGVAPQAEKILQRHDDRVEAGVVQQGRQLRKPLVIAGVAFGVFNRLLGGEATFDQHVETVKW